MNKFDEAIKILGDIEWLLDKMSDWLGMNIRERNKQYETDEHLYKIYKTLELGKLYKELSTIRYYLFTNTDDEEGERLMIKEHEICERIKELENE